MRIWCLILWCVYVTLNYADSQVPHSLRDIGVTEYLSKPILSDYQFKSVETGDLVDFSRFFESGKPVLISFVYYSCPMLCHFVTGGLVDIINQVSQSDLDELSIVSISINPNDTQKQGKLFKKRYLDAVKGVTPNWQFYLDDSGSVQQLADELGFHYKLSENGEYAHSAVLIFLSPDQLITRYLYGINYTPFDLKLSIIESKKSHRVSTVERLLLFCYNYDPQSRKYSIYAIRLMRVAAFITIFILLITIWRYKK